MSNVRIVTSASLTAHVWHCQDCDKRGMWVGNKIVAEKQGNAHKCTDPQEARRAVL